MILASSCVLKLSPSLSFPSFPLFPHPSLSPNEDQRTDRIFATYDFSCCSMQSNTFIMPQLQQSNFHSNTSPSFQLSLVPNEQSVNVKLLALATRKKYTGGEQLSNRPNYSPLEVEQGSKSCYVATWQLHRNRKYKHTVRKSRTSRDTDRKA